jgi:hypothetical protein
MENFHKSLIVSIMKLTTLGSRYRTEARPRPNSEYVLWTLKLFHLVAIKINYQFEFRLRQTLDDGSKRNFQIRSSLEKLASTPVQKTPAALAETGEHYRSTLIHCGAFYKFKSVRNNLCLCNRLKTDLQSQKKIKTYDLILCRETCLPQHLFHQTTVCCNLFYFSIF